MDVLMRMFDPVEGKVAAAAAMARPQVGGGRVVAGENDYMARRIMGMGGPSFVAGAADLLHCTIARALPASP